MTISHRRRTLLPDEVQAVNEPGLEFRCDGCACDLTHSIRIKCADPVCEPGDGIDICPACFCAGKEFNQHKRGHAYRVVELHSYPIFVEDWGADEELLLLEGIALQGLGNWQAIAEHVGTRTKEEVEQHYNIVYINSPDWPLPQMDMKFDVDPETFQERKRRRISNMNSVSSVIKTAPTSAPGVHEIATFLPGRLEFEHEFDHEAEDLVKDLEIGVCLEYDGDKIVLDENDNDVRARVKLEDEKRTGGERYEVDEVGGEVVNGLLNGRHITNGAIDMKQEQQSQTKSEDQDNVVDGETAVEEVVMPPPIETRESLDFKLTLLEIYLQRVDKRVENKSLVFERGLLEYKKMQVQEKKRTKDEKDYLHRLRPLAKLQTAEDFENLVEGVLYEAMLRRRIQELQIFRRLGLTTASDIEKYEFDNAKRISAKLNIAQNHTADRLPLRTDPRRGSTGPEARRGSAVSFADSETPVPRPGSFAPNASTTLFRKPPAPLNLANSASLHLLTKPEQTLCSSLRIFPKPYLVIKDTILREYARRKGKLRRREARDLVKIDVKKSAKIWDFLVQAGYLKPPLPDLQDNVEAHDTGAQTLTAAVAVPTSDNLNNATIPPVMTPFPSFNRPPAIAPAETIVPPWPPS